jgi:hypothetical protein
LGGEARRRGEGGKAGGEKEAAMHVASLPGVGGAFKAASGQETIEQP